MIVKFPDQLSLREDCYEAPSSNVHIQSCLVDSANNKILVTLEVEASSMMTQNLVLEILTRNGAAILVQNFDFYIYSLIQTDENNLEGIMYNALFYPNVLLEAGLPNFRL